MKEIIYNRTEEVHEFIAEDGKKFATEKECREHESKINSDKVIDNFSKISTYIKIPFLDVIDCYCYIATVNNKEEFYYLYDYNNLFTFKEEEIKLPETFPKKYVCIEQTAWDSSFTIEDEETADYGTAEKLRDGLKDAFVKICKECE